jgi:phosphatidylinositol 4-kinase B
MGWLGTDSARSSSSLTNNSNSTYAAVGDLGEDDVDAEEEERYVHRSLRSSSRSLSDDKGVQTTTAATTTTDSLAPMGYNNDTNEEDEDNNNNNRLQSSNNASISTTTYNNNNNNNNNNNKTSSNGSNSNSVSFFNTNRPSSPTQQQQQQNKDTTTGHQGKADLLLRFFDSEFFDEWIAISYLWRAKSELIVEYLCNKMLEFDDDRAERYLSQILTLLMQRKIPKLENVVIHYCTRSARLASKTVWLLQAAAGDVKYPKPLLKLKSRCYKAAIESGTWKSPFEKWPKLPNEKYSEEDLSTMTMTTNSSNVGMITKNNEEDSDLDTSRNGFSERNFTSCSEDEDDDSAHALSSDNQSRTAAGAGAAAGNSIISASSPPQSDNGHTMMMTNKKQVLLSVPNTPVKSTWFFGSGGGGGASSKNDEKPLKTPPSSPPQQKSNMHTLDKVGGGPGSNSSSTGFLSSFFGKAASKLYGHSMSSPTKGNSSQQQMSSEQTTEMRRICELERKNRQLTFDQTSQLALELCGLSGHLAKTFPVESRQDVLRKGIEEVNKKLVNVPKGTGVMYPLGAIGKYRIVRIPAQEAMLLNSREKAPYLICFEVIGPQDKSVATEENLDSLYCGNEIDERGDVHSNNNSSSFSGGGGVRRNPFLHQSNNSNVGDSSATAQNASHDRRNSMLHSLGESGALDIPMGGGRRHGRAGSYDASSLPVPDEEFLARSLKEKESMELAASRIAEQRLSFDQPRPIMMSADHTVSSPPSAETTPQKSKDSWAPKTFAGGFTSFISKSLSPMMLPEIKEGSGRDSPDFGSPTKEGCAPMGFNSLLKLDKMTIAQRSHDTISDAIDSAFAKVWDETTAIVSVRLDIVESSNRVYVTLEIPHLKKEEQDLLKLQQLQQQEKKKTSFFTSSKQKKEDKLADVVDPAKLAAKNSRHARTPSDVGLVQMARRMRRGSDDATWAPEADAQDATRNPRGGSIMEQLSPFLDAIGSDDDEGLDHSDRIDTSAAAAATSLQFHKRSAGGLGERWVDKVERIRRASPYGNEPGWCLKPIIVKAGDNCRQELLAIQLVRTFAGIFAEANLPLWIKDYEVLTTSTTTAFIEAVTDSPSLHAVKSRAPRGTTLKQHFESIYGGYGSAAFRVAQRNFVESLAGYSILTYLLQIKDRHNGNILLREDGRLIHIDFNFMLSTSPGGINFESSPFKLTKEYLELMDSDADGVASEAFNYYKVLCIQGYLACRKHAERILLLVEMMAHSGCPCFKAGPKVVQNLRKRFNLGRPEEQVAEIMLSMISDSMDAWSTRQYDFFQRVSNGIL